MAGPSIFKGSPSVSNVQKEWRTKTEEIQSRKGNKTQFHVITKIIQLVVHSAVLKKFSVALG